MSSTMQFSSQAISSDCVEEQLILCCARTFVGIEDAKRIKNLTQHPINWDYLIQIASRNGVVPLLYKSLNTTCPESITSTNLAQLRKYVYASTYQNLILTRELSKLLKLFESHQVPAFSIKGPVLAISAFGDPALRQFGDLDIFVHQKDIQRAEEILLLGGYKLLASSSNLIDEVESGEYYFYNHNTKTLVDLHWDLSPSYFPYPISEEQLWQCLEPTILAGDKVLSLPIEELLVFLCMHGSKHLWIRLAWICDIAEIVRSHPEIDWDKTLAQAISLRSKRMLLLGLFLAHSLLGAKLTDVILAEIDVDPTIKQITPQVRKWIFADPDSPDPLGQVEGFMFYIKMRESFRDRFQHFLYLMKRSDWLSPSKRDETIIQLPAYLSFLYYVIRPLRVAKKYGLRPLGHLLGFY